jgi:hypothetical protein
LLLQISSLIWQGKDPKPLKFRKNFRSVFGYGN